MLPTFFELVSVRCRLLFIALLLLFTRSADAQRVGFSLAKTKSDVVTMEHGSGYSFPDRESVGIGVSLRQRLAPAVLLQPELLLVQRGWSDASKPTLSLSYVELPLLVRVGALSASGWPVRPVLTFGPTVSLLATCSLTGFGPGTRLEGSGCSQKVVQPYAEDFSIRRFDAGLLAGVGLEVRTKGGTILSFDGRYEYGMVDIMPGERARSRNGTFFIMFSVFPRVHLAPAPDASDTVR